MGPRWTKPRTRDDCGSQFKRPFKLCRDPVERFQAQRILRHGLLVMLQPGDPEQWISAAESIMDWLNADRDWSFFDVGETEHGSVREEGEEEDRRSDDETVDLQDRYDYE